MAEGGEPGPDRARDGGFWARLWRRPTKWFLLGIPAGGALAFLVGIAFSGAFVTTVEATSTLQFCTSCHEMDANVGEEYRQSVHYQNAAGVRAVCADCHVPHALIPKLLAKTRATFTDVPAHLMGKIDTREKFEAHRAELAERVWARMRANNSANCRSCHSYAAMALDKQGHYAQRKHTKEYVEKTGKTCIDCHSGIAHKLPEDM